MKNNDGKKSDKKLEIVLDMLIKDQWQEAHGALKVHGYAEGVTAEFFEEAIAKYGLTQQMIKAIATFYKDDIRAYGSEDKPKVSKFDITEVPKKPKYKRVTKGCGCKSWGVEEKFTLFNMRNAGKSWGDIARALKRSPTGVQIAYSRFYGGVTKRRAMEVRE